MSKKKDSKAEIKVPKHKPIVNYQSIRSSTSMTHPRKNLWSPQKIDSTTNEYDIISSTNRVQDNILKNKNPQLLALRNKTAKTKNRPPAIRPITATDQYQSQYSLLTRPTTTANRSLHPNSVNLVQKAIENERASISFQEDPISYFAKRKEGGGHKFIYLNYTGNRSDPFFNPYDLVKVPFAEVKEEHFTMSASGVTRVLPDGNTEQFSIDIWVKESSMFASIRKLRFFSQYYYWHPFRFWKKFVMQQRYNQITQYIYKHPYWSNGNFFSTILSILVSTSDTMIKKYILPFLPQKKFTLTDFHKTIEENKKSLFEEYSKFLNDVTQIICNLYTSINDPERVKVEDTDFQEIKRKNPNIEQLIVLEQKVHAEKERRIQLVKSEISQLSSFIRMIDYILLESMAKSCSESWSIAASNISQEQSGIFLIELSFSEKGQILFDISLDTLIDNVRACLHDSFITLNNLPRLNQMPQLIDHILPKEKAVNWPTFENMRLSDTSYSKNEDIILNVITSSYLNAEVSSQTYTEYFSIFKLGKGSTSDNFVKLRGGDTTEYNLSKLIGDTNIPTPIIYNRSKEETIDTKAVRSDIERFKKDSERMNQFHICTIRGCLFVDCRNMKNILTPIPTKALETLHFTLCSIFKKKIELLNSIFTYCSKKLKKEPASLEQYVDFCDFTEAVGTITPYLAVEITLTDELRILLEELESNSIEKTPEIESSKNLLHDAFKIFKDNKQTAKNLKEINEDKFVVALQQRINVQEQQLNKLCREISNYPTDISSLKIDSLLNETKSLKIKIFHLEPEIVQLQHCQNVMGTELNELSTFQEIKKTVIFNENLYKSIINYNDFKCLMEEIPFGQVEIDKFANEIDSLYNVILELKASNSNLDTPSGLLLNELYQKVNQVVACIDQLRQLANRNMKLRHWNRLFEECGQPNQYSNKITIFNLMKLGILSQKDKIQLISSNAQRESQLETDFSNIKMKWTEVQLPLLDSQVKADDSLLLGDVDTLFQEISDAQIRLQQMLSAPFVQTLRAEIQELSDMLENYANIIDAWVTFQSNWTILSSFFSQEETKTFFEAKSKKFQTVRRRWMSLVRHTLENTSLYSVCTFPTLLDMLVDNNKILESILVSLSQVIDKKREVVPRLYFLSNDEIFTMLSTNDFNVFNHHLIKLFMHIKSFEYRVQERNDPSIDQKPPNIQDFSKYRIYGLIGDTLDSIVFDSKIFCGGQTEKWIEELINVLHEYVKNKLIYSLQTYSSISLNDWLLGMPTYIAILTLLVTFTRDIDDCFSNLENNSRTFINYENSLNSKISELTQTILSPISHSDILKLSNIITLLNYLISIIRSLSEKVQHNSPKLNWKNRIKLRFNQQKKILTVEFGDVKVEHGYEYWGSGVQFIYTPSNEKALMNLIYSIARGESPYFFGSSMNGKKHLISDIASIYGTYLFDVPSFHDKTNLIIERLLIGAVRTGFWLTFHNIQLYSQQNLCFLYESIREIMNKKNSKQKVCFISGNKYEFNSSFAYPSVFFTGDRSIYHSEKFPHQFRSFLKPIAMSSPDIRLVAEIKLISYGFKSSKHLSSKLFLILNSVLSAFSYLNLSYVLKPILSIIDNSNQLFRFLLHNKNHNIVVDYYESARTAEEFVVARSVYDYFEPRIEKVHVESFIQILYGHFQIFNNFDDFKSNLLNKSTFPSDHDDAILTEIIKKVVANQYSPKLTEYLIDKTLTLYHMMEKHKCIIIYGSLNSGKSEILNILNESIKSSLNQNEDKNKFINLLPFKIFESFYSNDKWTRMYGEMSMNEEGPVWLSGQIHSFFNNLSKIDKTHHNILRLNGPISSKFISFLNEILHSVDSNLIRLNTMDSYYVETNFHIIIETDSISEINPSMMMNCALLPMKNLNFILKEPENIFKRALKKFENRIDKDSIEIFKKIFIEITPEVIKLVHEIEGNFVSKKVDKNELISDHLVYNSIKLAFYYFEQSSMQKQYDERQIKTILILAFFNAFSGIISPSSLNQFDNMIRLNFLVEIPPDWVGFNIPDTFWDLYQRPSIQSLRFYKGKLIPLDYSLMFEKPIQLIRVECPTFKLPSDFSVCTAQFLPIINEAQLLSRKKEHFILHGPKSSGKTSLLNFVFHHLDGIVPITIPVTKLSTGSSLQDFINTQTPIITKKFMTFHETTTYALIFDNVSSDCYHAIEFIRMLITTSMIPVSSRKDSKFLDELQVQNFFVVVVTDSISTMSARFLSRFFILHLDNPQPQSMKYVINQLSEQFDISPKLVEPFSLFAEQYSQSKEFPFIFTRIIEVLSLMNEKTALNERDTLICVRSMLFELNYLFYHRITSLQTKEKLKSLYQTCFSDTNLKGMFSTFLDEGDELLYPEINLSNDLSSCSASIYNRPLQTIKQILSEKLDEYNKTKGNNRFLSMPFYRPFVNEIMLLLRAISYPGTSVILKGSYGSGRFKLASFVSYLKDYTYYQIPIISPLDDGISHEMRRDQIKKFIHKPLIESILSSKQTVIFFRIDSSNKIDADILSNLFLFHDFSEYLSLSELDDILYKAGTLLKLKYEEKQTIYQQIVNSFKLRSHFIIAADYSFDSSKYNSFVEIKLQRTDEFNLSCAVDLMKNPLLAKISQQMPENMPLLLTKIHSIIRTFYPYTLNCQFDGFLSSFVFYVCKNHQHIVEKGSSIKIAIDFKNRLQDEIKFVEEKKKALEPALQTFEQDDGNYKKVISDKKSEISQRKHELEEEERLKTAKLKQTREQLLPLKTSMVDLKIRLDLASRRLNEITPQQIEVLHQEGMNPSPAFKELIEMYCVFMNVTPQYEPYGKRLLYDPKFLEQIKEKVDPQKVDKSMLSKAKVLFNESQFNKSDFDNISMPCSILHDYIDIVYRYSSISIKIDEDTQVYDQLMLEFNDFTHSMTTEKGQLSQRNKTLDRELKTLQNSAFARDNLTKEIEALESKKRILENLFKGFDVLGDKWKQEIDNYEHNLELLIGNSILFACFVTYFGTIKMNKRMDLINDICDEIRKHGLVANTETPLEYIESLLTLFEGGGFGESECVPEVQNDIRLIKSVPRTPLIIDPDCVVLNAFMNCGKIVPKFNINSANISLSRARNPTVSSFTATSISFSMSSFSTESIAAPTTESIVVTSLKSSNLFKALKSSAKNGYTLLLEDVDFLDFQLIPFLASFSLSKKVDEIALNSKTFKVHPNFRLYLFTSKLDVHEIPENLRSFTTIVDVTENSLKSVQRDVTCCFLNHFDPEMIPRLNSMQRSETQNNFDILKYEKQTLDSIEEITNRILKDDNYDYLSDDDKLKKLLQSKECYFAATNVVTDFTSIFSELKMTIEMFTKSIRLCLSFWISLNRYMTQVRSCHFYSLPQFTSLITSAVISLGFHEGILQSEHLTKINTSLINHIMKWSLPTMSLNESLMFLFISAYEYELFEGNVTEDDLTSIFQHIKQEYDGICDFTIIDWHNGSSIDQLKFTNIVNIYSFVERCVSEQFGSEYKKFFPFFSIESFISNSSSVPVLIQLNSDDNTKDATQLLEYYIALRSKASSYLSISLCEDLDVLQNAKKTIEESLIKDVTIAIHYPSKSTFVSSFINDFINIISTRRTHDKFRCILICSTTDGMTRNILRKCVRIEYETFPSMKQQMLEIYNHHASAMQSSNSQIVKKQIYSYSLLFSLIRFRHFMNPIGFNFDVPIEEVRLRNFFVRLKELTDSLDISCNSNLIPIKNIRDYLLNIELGCGVFDQYDLKKLKYQVYSSCSSDIVNDGFCFIDSKSEEIDKWTIPNDVSSLNYNHSIEQRIPLFQSTEILMMNEMIGSLIQNWCLSRWISNPFRNLSHETELITILEAKSKLNEVITKKLPKKIDILNGEMKSPTQLFLYNEIQSYNKLIDEMESVMNTSLYSSQSDDFLELFRRNRFPNKWANHIKMSSSYHFTSFLKYLNDKYKMMVKWLKNSVVPSPVDVRLISDLKSLMFNYMNEIAIQRQMTTDVLTYEFVFSCEDSTNKLNDDSNGNIGLYLSGLYLVGGNWDFNEKKLVQPNSKTLPISCMPNCLCIPVKTATKTHQHLFLCPLYRSIPSEPFLLENDKIIIDGVSDNFQWTIPLRSDLTEKSLVSTGVSLICQKPDIF